MEQYRLLIADDEEIARKALHLLIRKELPEIEIVQDATNGIELVALVQASSTLPIMLFSLLAGDLGQLDSLFEVDGSVAGESWNVSLKARSPALARAIGAISLDGGAYVRSIRMVEESGDRTEISFSDIKTGPGAVLPEEAALL